MKLTKQLKADIIAHAFDRYPAECCGLIIDEDYYPCDNVAVNPTEHFEIDPKDFARAESMGQIQAIVHSHPDGGVLPSDLDKLQIELHGVPWVIVAVSKQDYGDEPSFGIYEPCGYRPPLLGRNYIHGVQDCYSLVRDYYSRELDINLPDFERSDTWWEHENHEPLYEKNFAKAGFMKVQDKNDLQKHDVILCRVGRTHHVNHALIWLGDDGALKSETTPDCVGNALILHHPYGRQSVREIYGKGWADRTAMVVRHNKLHKG